MAEAVKTATAAERRAAARGARRVERASRHAEAIIGLTEALAAAWDLPEGSAAQRRARARIERGLRALKRVKL